MQQRVNFSFPGHDWKCIYEKEANFKKTEPHFQIKRDCASHPNVIISHETISHIPMP